MARLPKSSLLVGSDGCDGKTTPTVSFTLSQGIPNGFVSPVFAPSCCLAQLVSCSELFSSCNFSASKAGVLNIGKKHSKSLIARIDLFSKIPNHIYKQIRFQNHVTLANRTSA